VTLKDSKATRLVGLIVRCGLAAVWLYAGLVKLFQTGGAREAIVGYRLFPASWVSFLGYALPAVEVALGLLLLAGLFTRLTAIISGLLFLAFIAGLVSVWARGYSIDCGCFGGGGDVTAAGRNHRYTLEVIRDSIFTLLCAWLVFRPRTLLSLDGQPLPEDATA